MSGNLTFSKPGDCALLFDPEDWDLPFAQIEIREELRLYYTVGWDGEDIQRNDTRFGLGMQQDEFEVIPIDPAVALMARTHFSEHAWIRWCFRYTGKPRDPERFND